MRPGFAVVRNDTDGTRVPQSADDRGSERQQRARRVATHAFDEARGLCHGESPMTPCCHLSCWFATTLVVPFYQPIPSKPRCSDEVS
jgi:hypothetical protein